MAVVVKRTKPKPREVFIDTETTGLRVHLGDRAFMDTVFNPSNKGNELHLQEWSVDPMTRQVAHTPDEYMGNLLADSRLVKVFFNAKFDMGHLEALGYTIDGRVEDAAFAVRITNSLEPSFRLKFVAQRYCHIPNDDEKALHEAVGKMRAKAKKLGWCIRSDEDKEEDYWLTQYAEELGFDASWRELARQYCMMDGIRTGKVWEDQKRKLDNDKLYRHTYERELELLRVVRRMEARGMAMYVNQAEIELEDAKQKTEYHLAECRRIVKKPNFNPGSSTQLARVLYDKEPSTYYPMKLDKASGVKRPDTTKAGDHYPVVFGLKVQKKTDSGGDSTDWKALRPYQENPLVRELMMYRSASKSIDTFFQKYLDMSVPDAVVPARPSNPHRIIHCSLNQCGTLTGRFSCSDPNLQQVANPESSPRGTDVHARRPFGPRPGYNWYTIDYAQMELRVFAECAQVPALLNEIYAGRDPNNYLTNRAWGGRNNPAALEAMAHSLELGHDHPTRQEIQDVWDQFGWDAKLAKLGMRSHAALDVANDYLSRFEYDIVQAEKSIKKSQSRQRGKTVMFVKYYGGGGSACADILYIPVKEASKFLRDMDVQFPEINEYIKALSAQGERQGFIVTRYGRKLRVDPDFPYRAVNYMIQGSCADLMKRSVQRVQDLFDESGLDAHVIMTVHDELIVEIKREHAYKTLLRRICEIMIDTEGAIGVPMGVEMKRITKSWESKSPVHL